MTPILDGSASFEGGRAMTLLKEKVLKGIVLRRTKIGRAADLALPPKTVSCAQHVIYNMNVIHARSLTLTC